MFSFTGQFDCLPNIFNMNPTTYYKDNEVSLFDFCQFEQNLVFQETMSQYKRLYLYI